MAKRIFGEKVSKDVTFALRIPETQFKTICKVALQFCEKGRSENVLAKCIKKFQIDANVIQRSVNGLSQLFLIATKQNMSESALLSSLETGSERSSQAKLCSAFYAEHLETFRTCLERMVIHLPEFKELDWRLDMEISKRTLHSRMEPHFMMQLDTINPGRGKGTSRRYLEVDYAHLKMLHASLKAAVAERDSVHVQRMKWYIQ
eukprot:g1606.t1